MHNKMFVYFILFVLIATGVSAYQINTTKDITLIITSNQIGIGVDNVFRWYSTSNSTTQNIPINISVQAADLNTTSYQPYFDKLQRDMMRDLIPVISNTTTNLPTSFTTNINETIRKSMEASLVGIGNDIVARINSNTANNCNYQAYINGLNTIIDTRLMPNITAYQALQENFNQCSIGLKQKNLDLDDCNTSLTDKKAEVTIVVWIMAILFFIILFILWMDYGGGGNDFLRKLRWKKTERKALNNSTYDDTKNNNTVLPAEQ